MIENNPYFKIKNRASSSMLKWLEHGPAYCKLKLDSNVEEKETKSLENGKLLHYYIEDPTNFVISDATKPSGMMGFFMDKYFETKSLDAAFNYSGFKEQYKKTALKNFEKEENQKYLQFLEESNERLVLTTAQKKLVERSIKALVNSPTACKYLSIDSTLKDEGFTSHHELPIMWDYEGIPCKSMLDKIHIKDDKILIVDLKTTSKPSVGALYKTNSLDAFRYNYIGTGWFNSYLSFRYYRQQEFYIEAVKWYCKHELGINNPNIQFMFVVINIVDTFDVSCYTRSLHFDNSLILKEIMDLLRAFQRFVDGDTNRSLSKINSMYEVDSTFLV